MAIKRGPSTPYDPERLDGPIPQDLAANEMRSPADLDNEVQSDPQLIEGPASRTRIALLAVGIAIVLGVVFYALNSSTMNQQASTVPVQVNSESSKTTGSAPANPQPPSPASTKPGGAETNNANPSNAPASK